MGSCFIASSSSSKTINLHPSVDRPLAVPCRQRGLASPTIHHSEHTRSILELSENLSSASFHDSLHTFPESSQDCCPQEQQNQSRCFLMFPCWILLAWPIPGAPLLATTLPKVVTKKLLNEVSGGSARCCRDRSLIKFSSDVFG